MRFLYTGSDSFLSEQNDPEKSLGGYCSKSTIPNKKNNLFSDISYLSMFNKSTECRAFVIENNSENSIDNLLLGYKYNKEKYKIEIAIVELNDDGKMEIIGNAKETPYYATFQEASIDDLQDDSISLDFTPNGRYGVWVKREIIHNANSVKCSDLDGQVSTDVEDLGLEFIIKYEI